MNDQRSHVTLSNLFSSLSNLANNQIKLNQEQVAHVDTSQGAASSGHLITSVQTAMAAALIQQQFAASAAQQATSQQLPDKLSNINQPLNFMPNKQQTNNLYTNPVQLLHQQPQPQPHPHPQPQTQPQQQRINFCTICNKELCNKYFMKTHMLKMHGINLGTEPTGSDEDSSGGNGSEPDEDKSGEEPGAEQASCSSQSEKKKSSSSKATGGSRKKYPPGASKQTTTMMNGYAGNSMGGVVCDICNKELCSKYFLKVHKQNTHGITSDYPDTSQFIYPFPDAATSAICPQNVYLSATQPPSATFYPPPATLAMFSAPIQEDTQGAMNLDLSSGINKVSTTKKQRLSHNNNNNNNNNNSCIVQQQPVLDHIEKKGDQSGSDAGVKQQFESIYRLLLAQQQQPPVNPVKKPHAQTPTGIQFDRMQAASNTMSSLMCFAQAPNPFALAAMSPAMIVDNILRNQHMFKRNQPAAAQIDSKKSNLLDSNNNNHSNKKDSSSTTGAGNNRYFSHYTEACPMCDRRFKSIKWLKTHMMNDHKQEIAGYMQIMMQYSYANKNQQMAAAATMAALERQRHDMLAQQLSASGLTAALNRAQYPPQPHLSPGLQFDSCFTGASQHFQSQSQSQASTAQNTTEATVSQTRVQFDLDSSIFSQLGKPQSDVNHVIDARRMPGGDSSNSSFGPQVSAYSSAAQQLDRPHQQPQNKTPQANSVHIASGSNFQSAPLPEYEIGPLRCSDDEESEEEFFS